MVEPSIYIGSLPVSEFQLRDPAVFPSNTQLAIHFPEFLQHGYKSSIGNIECKFPLRSSSREIGDFTVGVTDGFCKIIIMMTIVVMVKELDFGRDELSDPQLRMVLGSFSQLRCSYQHYENPAHFFLHSLRSFSIIFQCFYCTLIFVPRQLLGNNLFYNVLGSFLWPVP